MRKQAAHKPGPLKQVNKPFKGRSKSTRKTAGKVETSTVTRKPLKSQGADKGKAERRAKKKNELKVQRQREREARRGSGAPRLVVLVSLSDEAASAERTKAALVAYCNATDAPGPVSVSSVPNSKLHFTFVAVPSSQPLQVLEACLAADVLVPVVDAANGVSEVGMRLASAIKAQGLPAVLPVITELADVRSKDRHAAKKGLLQDLQYLFPNTTRVLPLDDAASGGPQQIMRYLDTLRATELQYLQHRSLLLAEGVRFEQAPPPSNGIEPEEPVCTLYVTGHIRGGAASLSANSLVHVTGCGDFHLERVWLAGAQAPTVLSAATDERPALQAETPHDPFGEGEQTWPTADEIRMAGASSEGEGEGADDQPVVEVRRPRRVPKGMSEYQAAWLLDDDDEEEERGSDEPRSMEDEQSGEDSAHAGGNAVDDDDEAARALDAMEEDDEMVQLRKREDVERQWPDEVDVPLDMPARERFAKFRGLDSFRTSVWDSKENLPHDYSRIYQVPHFGTFVRRNTQAADAAPLVNCAVAGQLVTLEIVNFPLRLATMMQPTRPLVVASLLKYEHKTSVLHFDIMRAAGFNDPLPSKEELVFAFGARRMVAAPLFSQHVTGCDKCKYERFLPVEGVTTASFYGPLTYTPCTVLVFKRGDGGALGPLVASGTLRTVNADLLIIKKIILTAHPTKIHKRTALCKGMFHLPEDVKWFKPVSVWTKHGRVGHIRESNGTKGDFKAVFDGQLNNADTVCMSLYRRIYPSSWAQPCWG